MGKQERQLETRETVGDKGNKRDRGGKGDR